MLILDIHKKAYGTSSDRKNCKCHAKHEIVAHLYPNSLHILVIVL